MGRKLGCVIVLLALSIGASAAERPGTISGRVKDSRGVPQLGAAVEIFNLAAGARPMTVFTDDKGFFSAIGIAPGPYNIRVSAAAFLPSLRENVNLRSGAAIVVNVTLNTLFEAMQLLPARGSADEADDWKWTLRSAANRPILRVLDDGPLVVVSKSNRKNDRVLKARVAFLAGSSGEGFGKGGDVSTNFSVERSIFNAGTLSVLGNVNPSSPQSATVLRARYQHELPNGSKPEVALTMRRFATPQEVTHLGALQALTLALSDSTTIADFIELRAGTELQTVQFMGRVSAFKPFGSVDVHLGPDMLLSYGYTTSQPDTRSIKGYDSAPADLSESGPRLSMVDNNPVLERARHQEVSVSRRLGKTNVQVAMYSDRIRNTALTGVGDVDVSGDFLPDVYSGTFAYNGGSLDTRGVRVVVERRFSDDLSATLNYSYGGVLDFIEPSDGAVSLSSAMQVQRRHAWTAKAAGRLPKTKTKWIASYKWTNGESLTPVDMFNASPGQSEPYLNVFLRQPLPGARFVPGKVEALVDVRNLLAQGYVPVVGNDGSTLYLVQSARAVRGGLAFVF